MKVECITCHRGASTPILAVDLLQNTYDEKGVDDALSEHDELKSQYYGSHTHDFTDTTLLSLAQNLHPKDPQASLKTLLKNIEMHPKSVQTLFYLGASYAAQKNVKLALEYFEQAYQLQPNPWLENKIKGLKEQL